MTTLPTLTLTDSADSTHDINRSASSWITETLTDYGVDIIKTQFPNMVDGLKKIHQRFIHLLTLGDNYETAVKAAKITSRLSDLHPYNTDSMYDSLNRLGQKWYVNPTLVRVPSNPGSYAGENQAATRYGFMGSSPFARALFFRDIDVKILPMERGPDGLEPKYFTPVIPSALLYDNLSIGFGYQSRTASLQLGNICDLVSAFAEHKSGENGWKPFDYRPHLEKFLPEFPTPCLLINADELLVHYERGEFNHPIAMEGRMIVKSDVIIIESLPHGIRFGPVRETIEIAMEVKNSVYDKKIQAVFSLEPNPMIGRVTIELKKGVNPFDMLDDLRGLLQLTGTHSPNPNYVMPTGQMINLNYINLLEVWYTARWNAIMATKRRLLQTQKRQQWIAEAQLVAVAHADRVVALIKSSESRDTAVTALCKEFDITPYQADSLCSLRLDVLTRLSGVQLEERRTRIVNDIAILNRSFFEIGAEISSSAQKLKKDFPEARRMVIPDYLGYVAIGTSGFVQIETWPEVQDIADAFPKERLVVHVYRGPHRILLGVNGRQVRGYLTKYGRGSVLSFEDAPIKSDWYTVSLGNKTGFFVQGVVMQPPGDLVYTKRHTLGITRKGLLSRVEIPKVFTGRRTLESRGIQTDLIFVYPEQDGVHYLVVLNPEEKNTIHLQRIEPGDTRISLSPVGDVQFLVHKTGANWFITMPEAVLNRCNVRLVQIVDAERALGEGNRQIKLDLLSVKLKKNPAVIMFN